MAYTLTNAEKASLERERNSLQETLDNYDSDSFLAALDAGITEAENVNNAAFKVWESSAGSSDGVTPRELVLGRLDGILINNPVPFGDLVETNNGTLFRMGTIRLVIDQIQQNAPLNPTFFENSDRIRLNTNRYYPDVDDRAADSIKPDSDSRNVFPDHPWFGYASGQGVIRDYGELVTLYQSGIFDDGGKGTNATGIGGNASDGDTQTSIDDGGIACFVGDNERFFIAMSNYLSTAHSTGAISGTNTVTGVNNIEVRGTNVGGIASLSSTASGSGTTEPATYSPSVNDVLSLAGGIIRVVAIVSGGTPSCVFTPPGMGGGTGSTTCTTNTNIKYVILSQANPGNGAFTNGSQGAQGITGTKRADYLALKRFTTPITKTVLLIDTPAINTQAEITTEIAKIITELGTQSSLIYKTKYDIANTMCNWNNGTISALAARRFTKSNLLSMTRGGNEPNEYSRTREKIEELQSILDGSS